MRKPRNIIIFGPQGSGKGTQAQLLADNFGYIYISTGDIFRRHVKNKTQLGKQSLKYIKSGRLMPDEITNKIALVEISKPKAKTNGFILDGYPRNLAQTKFLNEKVKITDAVVINLTDAKAARRIGGRRVCACGRTYHIIYNPPKKSGLCDVCGKKLFIRDDDKPAAIKKRLKIYHQQTEPILKLYQKLGVLKIVAGKPPIPEVFKLVKKALYLH